MLPIPQLITLDYWENVYNMVVATGGPIHVIFFTIVVFFGSFYLINLMLAVVAMSYEEEAEICLAVRRREFKNWELVFPLDVSPKMLQADDTIVNYCWGF